MTRAVFRSAKGLLCGFSLSGHAGGGSWGKDIVCAAISSAAYLTVNTLTDICGCQARIEERDGLLQMTLKREDIPRAQDLLRGLKLHLEQLQEQYPQRIRVESMEESVC